MSRPDDPTAARLRALPAVDALAAAIHDASSCRFVPVSGTNRQLDVPPTPAEAIAVARRVLEHRRTELLGGAEDAADLIARARAMLRGSPRRVLNATGVVLHTNLGRAPLAPEAAAAAHDAALGYVDLELDLASGKRGARDDHVRDLLRELTGAQDALVVNNGAAAALLAAAALAGPGRALIVSRGQLVEIGGGFRVPDVVAQAGARLVEVGTTNRTRRADYAAALELDPDSVLLRVHPSNFRTLGYVEAVGIEELCGLGAPVIDDVGSGVLGEDVEDEPGVRRSVAAGAALTCFSADKLLGGPQAGILVGDAQAIAACRRHPLTRALRVGRLPLAALQATLRLHRDPRHAAAKLPVLAMLGASDAVLRGRAERLAAATGGEVITASAKAGGGSLPLLELDGPVVALPGTPGPLAARLRSGDPPLLARIAGGRVLIDPRTLAEDELEPAAAAIVAALGD